MCGGLRVNVETLVSKTSGDSLLATAHYCMCLGKYVPIIVSDGTVPFGSARPRRVI